MSTTKIEWADAVWNPITGCTKISAGCKNCYAEKMFNRLKRNPKAPKYYGREKFSDVMLHDDVLSKPRGNKKPTKYFVNSMGDLFHENVTDEMLDELFGWMLFNGGHHHFLVLTKRPERMRKYFSRDINEMILCWCRKSIADDVPERIIEDLRLMAFYITMNLWLGVTAENQETALERIPILADTKGPTIVRFVSCEPLLEEIDLSLTPKLDWVIVGGETGHGARNMKEEWAIKIRDYCTENKIPFFFKSKGEKHKRREADKHDLLLGRRYQEFPDEQAK